jgi:uncharacterized protein (TIGR04255 family)
MALSRPQVVFRRPPLTEAVHEFLFDNETISWREEFWERIRTAVAPELPIVDRVNISGEEVRHDGNIPLESANGRRYSADHGGIVLTIAPGILGLSIRPKRLRDGYPGWDAVHEMAMRFLLVYQQIVETATVEQITVRYINRIPVVPGDFKSSNYISSTSPLVPPILIGERNPFSLAVTHVLRANDEAVFSESLYLAAGSDESGSHELFCRIDELAGASSLGPVREVRSVCRALHESANVLFHNVFHQEFLAQLEPLDHPMLASQ